MFQMTKPHVYQDNANYLVITISQEMAILSFSSPAIRVVGELRMTPQLPTFPLTNRWYNYGVALSKPVADA